ncbi:hypothetical protein [Arthrobacter bambusae]|uniref:hypothetical protein n=1 Tax=Arthrobacter bambusae TaxID=1338426 RepID=UPI00277EDB56|nr:hypothetical protein [Arthrobacter bambusae]MDQ0241445.1 hypothetical protein [Arthrobacter bambusae]
MTDPREAFHAATRLADAARDLAHATRVLNTPSDSYSVMGRLVDTQRSIQQVLEQLAEWHRSTSAGRHFSEGHDESTLGIITAIAELDLAAQQADGLQETISRAHGGSSVVRWFDDVDPDQD